MSSAQPAGTKPKPAAIYISTLQFQDPLNPGSPRRRIAWSPKSDPGFLTKEPQGNLSSPSKSNRPCANPPSPSLTNPGLWPRQPGLLHTHDQQVPSRQKMGGTRERSEEEKHSLLNNGESSTTISSRHSHDSATTTSSTSLILENINRTPVVGKPLESLEYRDDESDVEATRWKEDYEKDENRGMSKRLKTIIAVISLLAIAGWVSALFSFLVTGRYKHSSTQPFDHESPIKSSGRRVTLDHAMTGFFAPRYERLNWIAGANGEDGMLLETGQAGKDFLVVEDVRSRQADNKAHPSKTLLKSAFQFIDNEQILAQRHWPSPDLKRVLIMTDERPVYRHSYTGIYYIVDAETQTGEPLDPQYPNARVQLAQWAPTSDSIAFTRDNNLYVRSLSSKTVKQITTDGGPEFFYGIPDWVYEEEVLQTNSATWWSRDGQHIAFLSTNETAVPEYPVQFFINRPSRVTSGLENYPETTKIKYPKAGAPNPVVEMLFYSVANSDLFRTNVAGGFEDDDRIIADVLWTDQGGCLIKELNRVSDRIRMVLIDTATKEGKTVRTENLRELDGGWLEPGRTATFIPADSSNNRPEAGYVDIVVHGNNHHYAYFTPVDSATPIMLTTGAWDIEHGEEYAIDLVHNILYFVAAKEHPTSRHVYSVDLAGKEIKPVVPVDKPAYYGASFSKKAGFAIITNEGPGIPIQEVVSMPSNPVIYEEVLSDNKALAELAAAYELPHKVWSEVTVDGFTLQVVERRPPHFDPKKRYPVLFQQYSGPGSQQVKRKFEVDFQSYIASSLEYVVVTVDGRGTGYSGRKAMCITRGELGQYEARDQIETAKIWAQKSYVDEERIAIWGWSYGGFTTLKVLEMDAGQTFKYGMAVAPVTDWRFYDSIYTERYMFKPQDNQDGYDRSAIVNVHNMSQNVRFLMMHGTGDDNVHMQNSLALIDKLDLAGVTNYDVHFFPDSNHNIGFHGAYRVVFEKLEKWLVSAFNGAWYKYEDPKPE